MEVLLRADPAEVRRRVPPYMATQEPEAGGVVICFYAENLDWAARVLVGLGLPFEVRAPEEFRGALRRLADGIAAAAGEVG